MRLERELVSEHGVPHVVAMRYEVGDAYARDLASCFYRRLLADAAPKSADLALAMARRELLDHPSPEHGAVDHATPMLLGPERLVLRPPRGRSAVLHRWRSRPQPLVPGAASSTHHLVSWSAATS